MKVEWRREPGSRAVLEVEVPAETVAHAVRQAQQRLAQRVAIPGFRKGRAPGTIVERYLGRGRVIDEAIDLLIPQTYRQAVEESGLIPVGQPEVDVDSGAVDEARPLRFTAVVDVAPEVDPGEYRTVAVPRRESAPTPEDVDRLIDDLRLRRATLTSAGDAPAAKGDFVLIKVLESSSGGERLQSGKEYLVEIGGGAYPETLEDGLTGIRRGERRTLPAGNAGATATVEAGDVKRREIPALDDALAKALGAESVEALREGVRGRLVTDAARRAAEAQEDDVLRAVTERAVVDLPRSMVEHEVEHLLADFLESLGRRGLTLETYLRSAEKTEETVREEFRAIAEQRVRTRLVLDEIARREAIAPSEEEITHEVENLAQSLKQDAAWVRERLEDERRRDALVTSLRRRKTVKFLVDLASSQSGSEGV